MGEFFAFKVSVFIRVLMHIHACENAKKGYFICQLI